MATFDDEFAARHAGALREMIHRIGLDYFMVDCAETKTGDLWSSRPTTRPSSTIWTRRELPLQAPQMQKIFDAFAAML
jgi:hypothetical protein